MKETTALLLAATLFATTSVTAEVIQLPNNTTESENVIAMPQRGMTMQEVTARFGEPLSREETVGKPPITRWKYEKFTVYFESEYVIHSVTGK